MDENGQVVFTSSEDFNQGELFNVNADDVPGEVRLNSELTTYHHIWVSNSDEGTISKFDTRTGQELSRYHTGPETWSEVLSPSRTAVTSEGDAWVANRAHIDPATGRDNGIWQGSVVKILNTGFVDRNGNGVVNTSRDLDGDGVIGPDEILPWDGDYDGQPDDERIALVIQAGRDRNNPEVPIPRGIPRALAIDANDDIWVGCYQLKQYEVYDGQTGELEAIVPTEATPYGARSITRVHSGARPTPVPGRTHRHEHTHVPGVDRCRRRPRRAM